MIEDIIAEISEYSRCQPRLLVQKATSISSQPSPERTTMQALNPIARVDLHYCMSPACGSLISFDTLPRLILDLDRHRTPWVSI